MLITLPIFLLIIYGFHILVIKTYYTIFSLEPSNFEYLIPVIIMGTIGVTAYIAFLISKALYSILYTIYGTIAGFGLLAFQCCLLYQLVVLFCPLSFGTGVIITLIAPLVLSIYGLINASILKVDRVFLKFPGFNNRKTICHLSDIHLGAIYQKAFTEKIVDKVKELNPDVVVITGDMSDGSLRVKTEWLTPFNSLAVPVLYITGNHEQMHGKAEMLSAVEKTNIIYVGNVVHECCGMNFIGVDFEYNLKYRLNQLSGEYRNQSNKPNVLLHHIPQLTPQELKSFDIFLYCAGHTHGGQMPPFQLGAYLANKCFSGLYSDNNNHVYVSSGVGAACAPMRIGSSSVIGLITIEG